MSRVRRALPSFAPAVVAVLAVAACTPPPASMSAAPDASADWAFRIVDPAAGRDVELGAMLARLAAADVIFFGEQHDDTAGHRAQLELLRALGRTGRPVVLSLEMFERDVQRLLDEHLAGRLAEPDLLAAARPWSNYARDYRPLVELARSRGWPVIAANVPRPIASAVGRRGLIALDSLPASERAHAAREIRCPDDDYRARFLEQMRSHAAPGAPAASDSLPSAMADRFYLAQCVKDETMAEAIVSALRAAPRGAVVLHLTGAFHSDYGQGVVERVRRRAPTVRLATIVAVPVRAPAVAPVAPHRGRADFVIFTRHPPARE